MFSQTSCSSGNAATLRRISNAVPCMLNTLSSLSLVCLGRQLSFRQSPRQSRGSRQSSCVYARALYGLVQLLLEYMGIGGCQVGAGSTVPRLNRRCGCVGFIAEVVGANGSNEVVGRSGAQGGSAGRLAASLRSLKSYAAKNCCYLRTTSRCALSSHEHLHVRKQGMAGAGWSDTCDTGVAR